MTSPATSSPSGMKHKTALVLPLLSSSPIQLEAILDPVAPARVAAEDVKIPAPLLLLALSRRKILRKKPKAPRLRFRRDRGKPQKPEQCRSIGSRPRPR